MTPLIPAAEVEAMAAYARGWLDQVKPLVLMEGHPDDPADVMLMRQLGKLLDCLMVDLCARCDLPAVFGVFGMALGDVYGQQDMPMRGALNEALAQGLTDGVEDAEDAAGAAVQVVGRA